jgi:hypothetical protein
MLGKDTLVNFMIMVHVKFLPTVVVFMIQYNLSPL